MIITKTDRIQLEELEEKHFDDLALLLANETVHALWPEPKTKNREQSRQFFERVQVQYQNLGYSFWAVIRSEDMQFLGICGLLPEEINGKKEVEVGYRIQDEFWGMGYGTEAAQATMQYAHKNLGWSSIISLILPANRQSIRVAEKNGLNPDGEKVHAGMIHTVYRKTF